MSELSRAEQERVRRRMAAVFPSEERHPPDSRAARPPTSADGDDTPTAVPSLSAGAFAGASRAFDPGRRGVRALGAVALVVVLVAAFFAWRARPREQPVAEAPSPAEAVAEPSATAPAAEVVVSVAGKVRKPGLVRLAAGSRLSDALAAAGGAEPGVDVAMLNPARKLVDGELIAVGVSPPPGAVGPAVGPGAVSSGRLNLNTATLADLDRLPGVGPVLAQRILDHREKQGGFRAVTDLRKVNGIGAARFEDLKDQVTV